MASDEQENFAQRTKIALLNDTLRIYGIGGLTMLSHAVAGLDADLIKRIVKSVAAFGAFTEGNDPWGERDFGEVEIDGISYFWKIDTYDPELEFISLDPADESVTRRVLTIMTAADL